MSGQGRSNDNAHIERLWRTLKYEYLYLRNQRTVAEYKQLLRRFVQWYNCERPHQALGYNTPYQVLTKTKTTTTNDSLSLVS
jgi:putative transposase